MSLSTIVLAALAVTGATAQSGDPKTIGSYTLQGCYNDTLPATALTGNSVLNYPAMTVEYCEGFCAGYTYFGLENINQSVSTVPIACRCDECPLTGSA